MEKQSGGGGPILEKKKSDIKEKKFEWKVGADRSHHTNKGAQGRAGYRIGKKKKLLKRVETAKNEEERCSREETHKKNNNG